MPRGGSKKGEHRGNAKRRVAETPGEIMREVVRTRTQPTYRGYAERRVEVARMIHGASGDVRDMTPREVMLDNMHHFMQAAFDWQAHLMKVAGESEADENTKRAKAAAIAEAEREIERYRNLASEDAYKVAPFIHPRLAAFKNVNGNEGESDVDIITALLNDIDARQREPKQIEHQANEDAEDAA